MNIKPRHFHTSIRPITLHSTIFIIIPILILFLTNKYILKFHTFLLTKSLHNQLNNKILTTYKNQQNNNQHNHINFINILFSLLKYNLIILIQAVFLQHFLIKTSKIPINILSQTSRKQHQQPQNKFRNKNIQFPFQSVHFHKNYQRRLQNHNKKHKNY